MKVSSPKHVMPTNKLTRTLLLSTQLILFCLAYRAERNFIDIIASPVYICSMRSIRTFSQLHKICHHTRQISSSSNSCCSVLNKHHFSCSVENNNTIQRNDINGASNNRYQSATVRALSSYTIRNNDQHTIFSSIKSLRNNHHHPISPTINTNNQSLRHFSASPDTETPIDTARAGHLLLKGLDVHNVSSEMDGHPLAVYTIQQN